MIITNIMSKIENEEKEHKFDKAREVYMDEIQISTRPAYHEKMLITNVIQWFDSKICKIVFNDRCLDLILVRDIKKVKELKKEYPNCKVLSYMDIVPINMFNIISEYINIDSYKGSMFRILYRHLYNDKKHFKVTKDCVEDGYVRFNVTDFTKVETEFTALHLFENHESLIKETVGVIGNYYKKEDSKDLDFITNVLKASIMNDINSSSTSLVSKETEAEIQLYKLFMRELDYFTLSRNMIYTDDKLYVFKNNEDRKNIKKMGTFGITVEDILEVALNETDIHNILDVKKYIYPCWRIAREHYKNQGMNYRVIRDEGNCLLVKTFL